MWLAASAMLVLSAGYLVLVVVSGKLRAGRRNSREKEPATPRKPGRPG